MPDRRETTASLATTDVVVASLALAAVANYRPSTASYRHRSQRCRFSWAERAFRCGPARRTAACLAFRPRRSGSGLSGHLLPAIRGQSGRAPPKV